MKTDNEVLALYEARKRDPNERWRTEAEMVKNLMNGDIWAPVTERFGENEHAVVANLAQINLNQMAKRATSTQPNVRYISTKPGQQTADAKARKRQLANLGWWDRNNMKLIDRKQARELLGFGRKVTQIGPRDAGDKNFDCPKWTVRDPLTSFPGPTSFQDSFTPEDCIFAYKRSYAWLSAYYPGAGSAITGEYARRRDEARLSADTMFELVEYIDGQERIILVVGRDIKPLQPSQGAVFSGMIARIAWAENRLEMCPVVSPSLITIDRLQSPYIGNYGMYIMRNKLAALEYEYAERTVFPERYFEEPPNSPNGDIIQQADSRSGQLGWVRGGQLRDMMPQPNFNATQTIDRLSGEERISNSTPAEMVGQSAENIRTGARGQQVASAAIDFTIQEYQEIFELAKEAENKIAVKVYKTYINKPASFYVGNGKKELVNFTPDDFESDEHHVFYAAAGADVNQLVISGGQRIAQQTMSRETFMATDPLIEDVESEKDRIQAEALRQAGFTQMMQPGAMDPLALASIASKVATNQMEWWEAVAETQKERQQAQASNGAPGDPNGPVEPGAPEAQPGIAPGAAQPTISASPDQQGLSQLLSSLRRPQMSSATGA